MYRSLLLVLSVVLIPGCGSVCDLLGLSGEWGCAADAETGSPELKAFESEEELEEYFSDQIGVRNDQFTDIALLGARDEAPGDFDTADGGAPPDPQASDGTDSGDTGESADDFSQTTIQEEGVDEADVVKTDGTYLYVIANEHPDSVLRIVRAVPPEQIAIVGEHTLTGWGREIYLYDGKVVALTSTSGGFFFLEGGGGGVAVETVSAQEAPVASDGDKQDVVQQVSDPRYERPKTIVTVIDVSTPTAMTVLSKTTFEGTQSSSRMIDGVLHLVLSNYQEYYYDIMPMLGRPELDVGTVDTTELLPKYDQVVTDGEPASGNTVTWRELYYPTDPDGFGVVTVVSLDVDNDAEFTAVGIVAQPGLIYASLEALYLTDTEYDFFGDVRETTDIYKFAFVDRGASPTATGSVEGRILNQYSMGEYQGYLRVATTVGRGQPSNNVYVLSQSGTTLDTVGSVTGIAPGETITAARFIGDRGYVVTFRQIDPLHTLDLSDPTAPTVEGLLHVPGFSTFIVPIDEDHLLTVGRYIPEGGPFFAWGVQVSIFDVSDFKQPVRTANAVIGEETGAESEALWNPKAFTYFAERGLVALPVTIYNNGGFIDDVDVIGVEAPEPSDTTSSSEPSVDEPPPDEPIAPQDPPELSEPFVPEVVTELVVFSVSAEDGLDRIGSVDTCFDTSGWCWVSFTRGVFIGDDVFAVTDRGVRGAPASDLGSAPYELPFD